MVRQSQSIKQKKKKKKKGHSWTRKKNRNQPKWKEYLKKVYFNPRHAGSYQGIDKLLDTIKIDGQYDIKRNKIASWLQDQPAFSLNKSLKRNFKRARVIVSGIDDQFEADLMSLRQYVDSNDGIEYLLAVIDVFSKHAWVKPLKNKKANDVIAAFENIFNESGRIPRRIRSDRGSEFTSKLTKEYLHNKGIHQFFTNNEKQANFVERFIKTFKSKLRRYMTNHSTERYIDILSDLIYSYNNTYHSTIGEIPANVDESNEKRLWWQMYWPKEGYNVKKKSQKKKRPHFKYNVGDFVRMSHLRSSFQREYDNRWTGEIFTIQKRFIRQGIPMYKLKDFQDESIDGSFYQAELQQVHMNKNQLFEIEEELKERTTSKGETEVLVKYKHWPKKFNEWVNVKNIS